MSDGVIQTCPVCGGRVRVVGETTLHYERVGDAPADDPALDGTDAAHAAWWRGHDIGVTSTVGRLWSALNGTDTGAGVFGHEKLEWLRRGVLAMRAELEHERVRYQSLDAHCTAHERSLMQRAEKAERRVGELEDALDPFNLLEVPDEDETMLLVSCADLRAVQAALAAQPERAPEPAGLFGKYIISKADGSPVDPNARYFVLRYDTDPYAWSAVLRYAQSVSEENPELAGDILRALQTVPPPEHPKLRRAAQPEREAP